MLLAVDVGNTQTVFGVFENGALTRDWRVATEAERTPGRPGATAAVTFENPSPVFRHSWDVSPGELKLVVPVRRKSRRPSLS